MSLLDSLAIMDAILFHASHARLKGSESAVLNAILHNTARYGRLAPLRCSHRYLAVYSGVHEKRHGEPLKALHEQGFIDYRKGTPTKDAVGHKNTQSEIRLRVPKGWEGFRDGGWNKQSSRDGQPSEGQAESGIGHEDRDPSSSDDQEGHEDRDLPSPGLSDSTEGHEDRGPSFPRVTETVTEGSRSSLPQGHGDRDLEGHEDRDPKGHGVDTPNGESLKRGVLKREVLNGKTETPPPIAKASLGVDAQSATDQQNVPTSSTSRAKGPEALNGGSPLANAEPHSPELGAEASAVAALSSLTRHVKEAGQSHLNAERRNEIINACTRLIEKDPEIEDQDLHYLLGLWAGDRALVNANHLYDHMRRHKKYLSQFARDMEAVDRGEPVPDEWMQAGIVYGQQKRNKRVAEENRAEDQDNAAVSK